MGVPALLLFIYGYEIIYRLTFSQMPLQLLDKFLCYGF